MSNIKPSILVIGTDHFTPQDSGDLFKTNKPDMLSTGRQKEIKEVIGCIKKFEPTKVALECLQQKEDQLNEQYSSYLNGEYNLTINEIDQVGFRLAKECNLDQVHAVDWNEEQKDVPDLAKLGDTEEFREATKIGEELLAEANAYLSSHSLKEYLRWLNDPEIILRNQELYMKLALVGDTSNPAGAMWTAKYWYYRNMLIYKNLVRLIESKEERIFVLYGSGHLHLLLQFLKESGIFDVKTASDYLT
mgnify:FL=1